MLTTTPKQSRPVRSKPSIRGRGDTKDEAPTRFEAKAKRRELLNLLRVKNAAKHLDHLPGPGCAIHAIMKGNYSYADIIPAVLKLSDPHKIEHLAATTLGFSQKAILQLLDMIDAGNVRTLDFICADFFEKADPKICQFARSELDRRGSRFASARCHAKIMLIGMDDGTRYTSESSANIRSCRSIEQFALTNDPDLYEFHREWINEIMNG